MTVGDVPAHDPTWYEATVAVDRHRRQLTFDLDLDVCVIGGGLAGLTVARELARRNWSVAVLEAREIAWNASGRNCGFVLPGFAAEMSEVVERVGLQHARAMWDLADAGRNYVRETVAETAMLGVEAVGGWLRVAKLGNDRDLATNAERLRAQFDAEVEIWSADRVRTSLASPLYLNAIHFPSAFHIHPLNYALGLAAAAERDGARIFEATPAIELDSAGVRKRVVTPAARVRAAKIVLAGNVYLGPLEPRLAGTLLPVTTFVAVTAPLGERLHEVVRYSGAVSDSEYPDNHYRIVGGDRLLWSGGLRTWIADPRRFARRLRADIARTFPQLGKIEIEHVWSGTLGRTVHQMPQIGELAPGVWLASGFGGHGLNTTAMAGMLIARAIAEGDTTWRLFQPYELVWTGGRLGRALIQVGYAGVRLRERAKALQWRRRRSVPPVAVPPSAPPVCVPRDPAPGHPAGAAGAVAADSVVEGRPARRRRRAAKPPVAVPGSQTPPAVPAERPNDQAAERFN